MYLGNYSDALADLQKAFQEDKTNFECIRCIDWILAKSGKWDVIIKCWTDYLEANPKDDKAFLERGGAYFHKKDFENALQDNYDLEENTKLIEKELEKIHCTAC